MYRGQPQPTFRKCPHCDGVGKIVNEYGVYNCTSCNGTGIDVDPGALMLILILWVVIYVIGLVWFFVK